MVAGTPACFPTGLRSNDFAVSHSPDSANATAAAIAWNLSLHDLILNLARRFNRFHHSSLKYRAKLKERRWKPIVSLEALFSYGSFREAGLH